MNQSADSSGAQSINTYLMPNNEEHERGRGRRDAETDKGNGCRQEDDGADTAGEQVMREERGLQDEPTSVKAEGRRVTSDATG